MFKLIKITNGRTNVPEPVKVKKGSIIDYVSGCVYYLSGNNVNDNQNEDDDLIFIPLETVKKSEGKNSIIGYIVSEGMVFETDMRGDCSAFGIGDTVNIFTDEKGTNCCVEATSGYQAKILNMDSVKEDGKVLVALKW